MPRRATCRGPGHRGQPPARRPARRPAGRRPHDRAGDRRRHAAAAPGGRGPARAHRVRPRRHPQPADREGDRGRRRRHGRAPEHHRAAPRRRRPGVDEGDERHRHHAAARRLPEGGVGAAAGGEVDHGGLRLVLPRPGAVHRGDRAAGAAPLRYAKDAVEVEGYVRGFARRRPDVAVGRAPLHQLHRPADRQPAGALPAAAGGADGARLRPAGAAAARRRRAGGAAAGGGVRAPPASSTSAAPGCCCCPS